MASLYHSSDCYDNTKVMFVSDLLPAMHETIGERLKRLRLAKGLSQTQLAKLCGVAQSTLSSIEGETRGYGLSIIAIAQALETTPEYLQVFKVHTAQEEIPEWPFRSFSSSQFERLDHALREEIEDRLLGAIMRQEKNGTNN